MPGEISLAHNGVLFLDELPEFSRHVLDQLREPIEAGYVNIVRTSARVRFLSQFQLIGAMNVCKCGYYGDQSQPDRCRCSASSIENYRNKVSGPLMDRIDLHVPLSRINITELQEQSRGESSAVIAQRVERARQFQLTRQSCLNAELSSEDIVKYCHLDDETKLLIQKAEQRFNLSARGYIRVLKLARSIADLKLQEAILKVDVMEALSFRQHL